MTCTINSRLRDVDDEIGWTVTPPTSAVSGIELTVVDQHDLTASITPVTPKKLTVGSLLGYDLDTVGSPVDSYDRAVGTAVRPKVVTKTPEALYRIMTNERAAAVVHNHPLVGLLDDSEAAILNALTTAALHIFQSTHVASGPIPARTAVAEFALTSP
jgi:hypothetical protein